MVYEESKDPKKDNVLIQEIDISGEFEENKGISHIGVMTDNVLALYHVNNKYITVLDVKKLTITSIKSPMEGVTQMLAIPGTSKGYLTFREPYYRGKYELSKFFGEFLTFEKDGHDELPFTVVYTHVMEEKIFV